MAKEEAPAVRNCFATKMLFMSSAASVSNKWYLVAPLTLLEPQSRFWDKPAKIQVVCPQNGTAVLKGLNGVPTPARRDDNILSFGSPGRTSPEAPD